MKKSLLYALHLAIAASLTCCSSGIDKEPSTAYFDYLEYAGNDNLYTEYPTTEPDQVSNPILPGWYSDPSICKSDAGYFLVTSTFVYFPGVPIFHSLDLVNWKQVGYVLSRESQCVNFDGQHVSGGIFAPAISYNPHNKTYYMITTNVGAGNFFVKTQDPFGEWSDPIYLPEVKGIDPSFFWDDNGKGYIVNNDDAPDYKPEYPGHRTIRVREFDPVTDKVCSDEVILVNKGVHPEEKPIWIEGPHMYKINGSYYLMDAEGGTGDYHSEVIFKSSSPMGGFVPYKNNPILTQRHLNKDRKDPVTCAGHADLVEADNGKWYGVFLACRPVQNGWENFGRETFMMPVRWSDDGFPYFTEGDELVPYVVKVDGAVRGDSVTFGNFQRRDEFNGSIPMDYLSLRGPLGQNQGFKDGHLSLKCQPVTLRDKKCPSFISRRIQHYSFVVSTKLNFEPADGERAGIVLFKDEQHQYNMLMTSSSGKREIVVEKVSKEGDAVLQHVEYGSDEVYLKITSDGPTFSFFYSADGQSYTPLLSNTDARHLSTLEAGGFTGTTIGLYADKK